MPRKPSGEFDQAKYQNEWKKQNMLGVAGSYKAEFVMEFREACKALGVSQSDLIRKMMQETIEEAKKVRE